MIILPLAIFLRLTPSPYPPPFSISLHPPISVVHRVCARVCSSITQSVCVICFRPSWHHSMVHASIQAAKLPVPQSLPNLHRIHRCRYSQCVQDMTLARFHRRQPLLTLQDQINSSSARSSAHPSFTLLRRGCHPHLQAPVLRGDCSASAPGRPGPCSRQT